MLATLLFASDFEDSNDTHTLGIRDANAEREQQDTRRDPVLVAALASDDATIASNALSAIIGIYFDRLVRFAYGFVASADTAEDIVQETFVRIWDGRTTLRRDASFRAYLFTLVRHRALNTLKHAAVEGRHATDIRASAEPIVLGVDDQLDAVRIEQAVRTIIAMLPERRRTVIRLRYEEALPFQTVAEIMGISEKAAKDLTARTIREIRARLRLE